MNYLQTARYGLILCALVSCSPQDDYLTSSNGLKYKIIVDNKQPKAQPGQFISYQVAWRNEDDSLLFSSENANKPQLSLVARPIYDGDPWEIFTMVGAGDSASCKVPAKNIFKSYLPGNMRGDDLIKVDVKVLAVYSAVQYDSVKQAAVEAQFAQEDQRIQHYMRENGYQAVKTASGLYVLIEQEGHGPQAARGNTVRVAYTGRLLDGTEFDSSRRPGGQPYELVIGSRSVIAGWEEGLTHFKEGGKGKLFIPSRLGYGDRGMAPKIGPNEPLAFDIELVSVK